MTTTTLVTSDWQFPTLAEFTKQYKLQSHSSRVYYDDADEPIVAIDASSDTSTVNNDSSD